MYSHRMRGVNRRRTVRHQATRANAGHAAATSAVPFSTPGGEMLVRMGAAAARAVEQQDRLMSCPAGEC